LGELSSNVKEYSLRDRKPIKYPNSSKQKINKKYKLENNSENERKILN